MFAERVPVQLCTLGACTRLRVVPGEAASAAQTHRLSPAPQT